MDRMKAFSLIKMIEVNTSSPPCKVESGTSLL